MTKIVLDVWIAFEMMIYTNHDLNLERTLEHDNVRTWLFNNTENSRGFQSSPKDFA